MLPGAPEKDSILCRNGAWAGEDYAYTKTGGQWAPLDFRTKREAQAVVDQMLANDGYLPDALRWKGDSPP